MATRPRSDLLLGEWACLGLLATGRSHGFAVATQLKPSSDLGRVWSQSRPLVYRALDHLTELGYVTPTGEEPGIAGGNRTIYAVTPLGRRRLRTWLTTPVAHLRDVRSELVMKVMLAERCRVDLRPMLAAQRAQFAALAESLAGQRASGDVVATWRSEFADAAI
ncbi:MAG TPA: PadR family transcriptional regulator, partial [Ilumatobacteraceae bacterium]|nr:PadR family transcriptional regulator [Ilumatobacteraceae bacterium]